MQRALPKRNSLNSTPDNVKGMQKTPSKKSLTARLNRKILVTVRMLLLNTRVAITKAFPETARTKTILYGTTRCHMWSGAPFCVVRPPSAVDVFIRPLQPMNLWEEKLDFLKNYFKCLKDNTNIV